MVEIMRMMREMRAMMAARGMTAMWAMRAMKVWRAMKAIYGLCRSPKPWGQGGDAEMKNRVISHGVAMTTSSRRMSTRPSGRVGQIGSVLRREVCVEQSRILVRNIYIY